MPSARFPVDMTSPRSRFQEDWQRHLAIPLSDWFKLPRSCSSWLRPATTQGGARGKWESVERDRRRTSGTDGSVSRCGLNRVNQRRRSPSARSLRSSRVEFDRAFGRRSRSTPSRQAASGRGIFQRRAEFERRASVLLDNSVTRHALPLSLRKNIEFARRLDGGLYG